VWLELACAKDKRYSSATQLTYVQVWEIPNAIKEVAKINYQKLQIQKTPSRK
jgi:hypothetical protein